MKTLEWIKGGVTAAIGFQADGIACGIKRRRKDLALIYSPFSCAAAGVFTQNRLQAAPVVVTRQHLRSSYSKAILVNSGNANCATGKQGFKDAEEMTRVAAKVLHANPKEVLVASTGVIGRRLPMTVIRHGIVTVAEHLTQHGSSHAAEAILTTDRMVKEAAVQYSVKGEKITLGAIAKGAGMIAPHMATMLCFITSDANISRTALRKSLRAGVETSFNAITIDGEMSTNDMVLILANRQAGNSQIQPDGIGYREFTQALQTLLERMARMIVLDAEGGTRFVEIRVDGAKRSDDARKVAFRIANSLLVKTMLSGADPNWGRVVACVGSSGVSVRMDKVLVSIGTIGVYHKGEPVSHDPGELRRYLKQKEVQISVHLGLGKSNCRVWTSDLSADYVKINAGYTT